MNCRPSDHTVGRPGPRIEPGPGGPEAGTLPLDHYTSLLRLYILRIHMQNLCYIFVGQWVLGEIVILNFHEVPVY